ncbi:hypothetical protein QYE76_000240 [Lolium multiflorum]|uniref:Uncharacterized protein n=1 Tax=Lolium multiflorum TaxID=4521 RepID=A0AAD8RIF5_LOLMU|nr:hypothetical protein QYE76_000240 [Lolium multiflorum]
MEDEDVLKRILDGVEDPRDLPLALLQKITGNFSGDRKIGQGAFGEVYMGVLGERIVAVKKIHISDHTIDDKLFRRELTSLMKISHENVIRFFGFCSHEYQKLIKQDGSGKLILASVLERLLCLEYISNGSLDKHITDELRGLDWETRYEIIIGICEGLRYLHGEKIIHMDLKPANILLHNQDDKYIPKITDFGLSRPNENSHTVGKCYGTEGYLAPEYRDHSETTPACDIYSLGAIIIQLVTGCTDIPNEHKISPRFSEDDMLGIKPLELLLPSELKNKTSRSVELTNGTRNCIAFNIELPSLRYTALPEKGIVQPEAKCTVKITVQPRDNSATGSDADKFIVKSMKVSQVLMDEDITQRMFEEAGEVVDDVNLVVAYEPMKPLKRSREDTNMSAEDVPKAKKREIVEFASGKGKNKLGSREKEETASMDISSRVQGQCTKQTNQHNFYPPQSFSRNYPTNMKYLGGESDRAVDVTSGAMGSLLDKLGKLVTEDYSLDMSIKSDIESLSVDLAMIHLDLPELENVVRAKFFIDEVRELSYNTEDMIDSFMVHVDPDSSSSGFREIMHESVELLQNGKPTYQQIGDVIRDIKAKVQAVADRQNKYIKNVVANASIKATTNLRISAIYEHKERLIGIKAPRDELIRLLEEDSDASKQNLRIIFIVGMGGLGKTTLVKAVYDKMKAYCPKAFVSVGQNPDVKTVLKNILHKFVEYFKAENLDVGELIEKIKEILKDKRYFIVIDDIWDSTAWYFINYAFPRNKHGSRVITTTRNHDVALACCENASKYVYRIKPLNDEESRRLFIIRAFGPEILFPDTVRKQEISKYILKKCGGMPLAINSIASLLAGEKDTTWEYIWKSLHALTKGITALENMKKILDLSYTRLPGDLKTCLIYVCMYPEDREIDKKDLLRQWVAEGFVTRKGLLDAEDVAENNFKALINMCLIEPGKIDRYNDEVLSCSVHDIILELIRSKSSEMNFIHVIDGLKDVSGQIRRVSVQHNDKEDSRVLETIKGSLSHARSVLLYRGSLLPDFLKYKYVRVLYLENWSYLEGLDLNGIRWLFLLRYLKVECLGLSVVNLPDQIGGLQQLETIDLEGIQEKNYPPDIVSLPWLRHLSYGRRGSVLPDGIDRLKSLHTLEGVCFHRSSVDNIKGLGELINLRKLEFISSEHKLSNKSFNMRMVALHSSISKLSTSLRILTVRTGFRLDDWNWSRLDACGWSNSMFPRVSNIRELNLSFCILQRCPGWISQLGNLCKFTIYVREVADGITIVAGLPSLAYYSVVSTNPGEKEESIVIHSGIFQSLKHLLFACPKTSLTFEVGAMPKLEKLQIWFRYHMSRRFLPVGVGLLQAETLKKITIVMYEDDMENKSFNYLRSFGYISYHKCRFGSMLKRAFKSHYPDADIKIIFDDNEIYDDNKYDVIPDNDEDSCCSEDDDEVVDYEDHDSEDDDEDVDDEDYDSAFLKKKDYDSEDDDEDVDDEDYDSEFSKKKDYDSEDDDEYYDCEEYGGASP